MSKIMRKKTSHSRPGFMTLLGLILHAKKLYGELKNELPIPRNFSPNDPISQSLDIILYQLTRIRRLMPEDIDSEGKPFIMNKDGNIVPVATGESNLESIPTTTRNKRFRRTTTEPEDL